MCIKNSLRYLLLLFTIMISCSVMAQNVVWRDQHQVKRKETIFGIAKEYGVTIQQLIDSKRW